MKTARFGRPHDAQVDRQGCALILADTCPEKIGKGLVFISLNVGLATHISRVAVLDALRVELEAKGVPVKEGSWGYRLLVVDDPHGNQLFIRQDWWRRSSGVIWKWREKPSANVFSGQEGLTPTLWR